MMGTGSDHLDPVAGQVGVDECDDEVGEAQGFGSYVTERHAVPHRECGLGGDHRQDGRGTDASRSMPPAGR